MTVPRLPVSAPRSRLLEALQSLESTASTPTRHALRILRLHANLPEDAAPELTDDERRMLGLLAPAACATLLKAAHPDELVALREALDELELWPEKYTALHPVAQALDAELDLRASEPLQWVMGSLLDAPALAREPLVELTLTEELIALRQSILPTPLHRWASCLRARQPALAQLFEEAARVPAPAAASSDAHPSPEAPPERHALARGLDFELSLVLLPGGRGMVEWYSETAPPPEYCWLEPLGHRLERAPDLVPGACSWWLAEPPLTIQTPLRLVLHGPSEPTELTLEVQERSNFLGAAHPDSGGCGV